MINLSNVYSVRSIECKTKSLTIDWNNRYWFSSSNESISSRNFFISADVNKKSIDQDCSINKNWSDLFKSLNEGTKYNHRIDSSKINEAVSHIISSFVTSKTEKLRQKKEAFLFKSYQVMNVFHQYLTNLI
jgi:hypothetical protein